jgi:hypothetical protein
MEDMLRGQLETSMKADKQLRENTVLIPFA